MMISSSVYSQDTLSIDTVKLSEVTIQGIRAGSKTPVTQKTITSSDIDRIYHTQELPMLLNTTPNVTSSTDGGHNMGYTSFRLRGIDQTRINMTLDGVPLNEPEDQGVYFSNYPDFTNSIKSMQIQRGVGTSTNGVRIPPRALPCASKLNPVRSALLSSFGIDAGGVPVRTHWSRE